MKMLRAVLAASLLVLPAVVAAQDVDTDFDKAFDFSKVTTYSIKIGTSWGNDLSERRVLTEFDDAIKAKGWKKAAAENQADIVVLLHGATQTKHNATTFYSGYGGYYRYGGGMGSATTMVSDYKVGTLVVDMFDAKTKNLVFRGRAEDEISDKPEKNTKKVAKATEKMFKNFPPKAKEK